MLVAERYELAARLGHGGMGDVWRGMDVLLGREVAVKLAPVSPDSVAGTRFQIEARSAASLSHPNVVAVFDFGEHEDCLFLVMELVHGPSLAQELQRSGVLTVERVARIAADVAAGLAAAHHRGIVHRDIKPANLFTTTQGQVKVGDFGIARITDDPSAGLTSTGQIMGTCLYIAPERILGHHAQPASDVYALGCVLYELLTGEPPFRCETSVATLLQHLEADPAPPQLARSGLPPAFEELLLAMLAKDPQHRPTTEHVAQWFASTNPEASPDTPSTGLPPLPRPRPPRPRTPRLAPPVSRRRAGTLAATATAAAVVAVGGCLTFTLTHPSLHAPATGPQANTAPPTATTQRPASTAGPTAAHTEPVKAATAPTVRPVAAPAPLDTRAPAPHDHGKGNHAGKGKKHGRNDHRAQVFRPRQVGTGFTGGAFSK
ncbi:serine/threonine-protein kinase [Streptacidiphilus neutrinimicus]|uniref:serine/threonine-protein kinase n=1 Tax=Streptacidiphilus neutrinimicus TaxID=105420 RepID=UPI000693675D|nr:serine/threonine-protein kinase [Streptacidiphilus neutrinimicus]